MYSSTLPSTSALDGVGGQCHTPAALPLVKIRYPLYRRMGGPQGRSGQVQKISPPPGFDPQTVQPIASRYTDKFYKLFFCCDRVLETAPACHPPTCWVQVTDSVIPTAQTQWTQWLLGPAQRTVVTASSSSWWWCVLCTFWVVRAGLEMF
jgi:hypothetical protein